MNLLFYLLIILSVSSVKLDSGKKTANLTLLISDLETKLNETRDFLNNNLATLPKLMIQMSQNNLLQLEKSKEQLQQLLKKIESNIQQSNISPNKTNSSEMPPLMMELQDDVDTTKNVNNDDNSNSNDNSNINDDNSNSNDGNNNSNNDAIINNTNLNSDLQTSLSLVQICSKTFLNLIPSTFCEKNPIEEGTSDILCGKNDIDYNSLCWEACNSGFTFKSSGISTLCYENCKFGYNNFYIDLICYKSQSDFYVRRSIIPKQYSKTDGRAVCQSPKIKFILDDEPLCFQDCQILGKFNCGPYYCVNSDITCSDDLIDGIDNILEEGKIIRDDIDFISDGLLSALLSDLTSIKALTDTVGDDFLNSVFNNVKEWLTQSDRNSLINNMTEASKSYINENDILANIYDNQTEIQNQCALTREIFYTKIISSQNVNSNPSDLDPLSLINLISACNIDINANDCMNAIQNSVQKWDPTWLIAAISLLKEEVCQTIN